MYYRGLATKGSIWIALAVCIVPIILVNILPACDSGQGSGSVLDQVFYTAEQYVHQGKWCVQGTVVNQSASNIKNVKLQVKLY